MKAKALAQFEGVICKHPLNGKGYDFDIPMLSGDFVTTETGTGFVHLRQAMVRMTISYT